MAASFDDTGQGPRDCGTFFLDLVCAYAPEQVEVEWVRRPRETNDEVERLIDETWRQRTRQAEAQGRVLFNGPICRLAGWSTEAGRLTLTLAPGEFREYFGTNATHAHIRYLHGPEVLADPLGVSAALVSADGFLLLGRRSRSVIQYPERIHPVGGLMEPRAVPDEPPDPFATLRAEVGEELALPPDRLGEPVLLGIVRDKHTVQPELIIGVRASLDFESIRARMSRAEDAHEHSELVSVRNDPASVVTFLEQRYTEFTPISLATLLLHGQRSWGSGWFANARGYLRSVI